MEENVIRFWCKNGDKNGIFSETVLFLRVKTRSKFITRPQMKTNLNYGSQKPGFYEIK